MLLTESFKNNLRPIRKESTLTEAEKKYHYITKFGFKYGSSLRDDAFDDAEKYLKADDMTQYIPEELKGVVTFVQWVLDDVDAVHVDVYSNRELTDEERKSLTEWIEGQNSDGLGEGFEQQDFAEAYYHPYTGDGPYTYQEVVDLVQENYDDMPTSEWIENISEEDWDDAIQQYIDNNNLDEEYDGNAFDNPDVQDEARSAIEDYPEDYFSDKAIEDAKYDVAYNDPDYNENEWGDGMTSMEWDVETIWLDGVEEDTPEVKEPEEKVEEPQTDNSKVQPPIDFDGPSEEDLKRIEEYRAKGWI